MTNSLKLLDEAEDICKIINNNLCRAKTYLNKSAVYSELNNHPKALQFAKNALIYFQKDYIDFKEEFKTTSNTKECHKLKAEKVIYTYIYLLYIMWIR